MSVRAVGVDIGGTKIAVGAVDGRGAIHARRTIPTDASAGFDAALPRLMQAIDATLADAGWDAASLAGVGLGCPGSFEPESGVIANWCNLPDWDGYDIAGPLAARYGRPVRLANDADAALRGEAFAGAAKGLRAIVMLTFGTGVGGAILIENAIYRGSGGGHPEIGHMPVDPRGPLCYCGARGCLEVLASGPAMARAGAAAGYGDAAAVFAAAEGGEAAAQAIVARALDAVETAAFALLHTILPDMILFGGGMAERHFPLYRDAACRAVARSALVAGGTVRIAKAALGNDAGLVGAAALAFDARPASDGTPAAHVQTGMRRDP